jgi:hypothetical protein
MTQFDEGTAVDTATATTGYVASRFNATRHGILARATVLAWEDQAEFDSLLAALQEEHQPIGPTEDHLLEEIAGIIWRKRRARLAEGALHNRALHHASEFPTKTISSALLSAGHKPGKLDLRDALAARPEHLPQELAELAEDEAATVKVIAGLTAEDLDYQSALGLLAEDTRIAWTDQLTWQPDDYPAGKDPYGADALGLLRYLREEISPWYKRQRTLLCSLPLVRAQALAESLDPDKLERLSRYEVHLDRKFERTLSTLLRLQELRRSREASPLA